MLRGIALLALGCAAVIVPGAAGEGAVADLEVNFITVGDPPQRTAGAPFSLRVGIGNNGPGASRYRLLLSLPLGVQLHGAPGTLECTPAARDLTCETGQAPPDYNSDGTATVIAAAPGSYTFVARLTELDASDPNLANNEASLTVSVVARARALVAGRLALRPSRPAAGSRFTVSFGVTDRTAGDSVTPTGARCTASPGRARARVADGRATCTVTTPARASGKTVKGTLTALIGGRSLSRGFSVRLR